MIGLLTAIEQTPLTFLSMFGRIVILLYCVGLGIGVIYIGWKASEPTGVNSLFNSSAQMNMTFALELSGAFLVFIVGVYLGYLGVFWARLEKNINIRLKTASTIPPPILTGGPIIATGPGFSNLAMIPSSPPTWTIRGATGSGPAASFASLSLTPQAQPLTLRSFTPNEDPRIVELIQSRRPMPEIMRMRRTVALERMQRKVLQKRRIP